jgi:hypothetical protein
MKNFSVLSSGHSVELWLKMHWVYCERRMDGNRLLHPQVGDAHCFRPVQGKSKLL